MNINTVFMMKDFITRHLDIIER